MSKIDERIVEMSFDNKKFEQGISESSKSLANFDSQLEKTGNSAGFGNLSDVVTGVSNKFSALGTIAVGALLEIGAKAVQAGEQLIKSLAIDPIMQGFNEYELKINSIKVMLASGKTKEGLPVTLEMVNQQLEELNKYADNTIYNFADMTSNIGKFTNAGVDLESSVQAIKGIANAAALSGANANDASRAMYNFSQGLSAGFIKLIDWKSIENANMATVEFKTYLLEAAVAAGTVEKAADGMYRVLTTNAKGDNMDGVISATKNFNDSLAYQWMTTEVLTDTLGDYADETTEIGKKATEAATKIRTFSQLLDTTKEAVGSGWAQSFEIMFGDFDEATNLWTGLSTVIGDFVSASSDARNKILADWDALGGRTAVIDGVKAAFEGLKSILGPIQEAFRNVFPPITGEQLANISQKFKEFMESIKIGPETAEKLKTAFQGLFSIMSLGWDGLKVTLSALGEVIKALLPAGDGLLSLAANVGQFFIDLKESADKGNFFVTITEKIKNAIQGISDKIREVATVLKDGGGIPGAVQVIIDAFKGFPSNFEGFDSFTKKITDFFGPIKTFLEPVGKFLVDMFNKIRESLANTWRTEGFAGFVDILNMLLSGGILIGIQKLIGNFSKMADSAGGFLEGITGVLDGVKGSLQAYQDGLKAKTLLEIAAAVAILAAALIALAMIDPEKLTAASIAMGVLFAELAATFVILEKTMSGTKISKVGLQLIEFSLAILILSNALQNIAEIPAEELSQSILALTIILGELVGVSKLMTGTKGFSAAAFALIEMAVAIRLIVSSVKPLGEMDYENLQQGLLAVGAIAVGMAVFAGVISKIGNGATLLAAGTAMGLIAIAILEMTGAVAILGNLKPDTLIQGLVGLGVILTEIAAFSILISNTVNPVNLMASAAAMVAMGLALVEISGAVAILGALDTGSMIQGLVGLAGAMGIMVGAMLLTANPSVLLGAAAMLVMAASVLVFTPAIIALGAVPLENIGKALLALVGVFAIVGIAGLVLGPLTPVIIGLAAAIALLGVAVLAIGAGMALFGAGLAALAAGGTAAIGLLVIAITEIAMLIPNVLVKIGEGIVALAGVIAKGAPVIAEAIIAIISNLIVLLTGEVPKLITVVLTFIGDLLTQLVDKVPEFVDAGMKIIIGFLEGVANNIQPVIEAVLTMLINILEGIASKLPDLIAAGVSVIVAFLQGIGQEIPRVVDAGFKMVIDFINGIANAIRDNTQPMIDAFGNLASAMIEGLVKGLFGGITAVKDAVVNIGKTALDGIKNFLGIHSPSREFKALGEYSSEGFAKGISGEQTSVMSAVNDMSNKTLAEINNSSTKYAEAGRKCIAALTTGFKDKQPEVISTAKTILEVTLGEITAKSPNFMESGRNLIAALITGFKDKQPEVISTAKTLIEVALGEITSQNVKWVDVGKNLVAGFIQGIESKIQDAARMAARMAAEALAAANRELDIRSPSRAFATVGRYSAEGMAQGLYSYTGLVEEAAGEMGVSALSIFKTTMQQIADIVTSDLDMENTPVIRPVIDLTDARVGAIQLSRMLTDNEMAINISRTMQERSAPDQRGINETKPEANFTFTQNNYSPKALSRLEIYRQTKNQFSAVKGLVESL